MPVPDDPTPGLRSFIDHQMASFAYNINLRVLDEGRPPLPDSIRVREINVAGRDSEATDLILDVTASAASPADAAPAMEPVEVFRDDERGVVVSAVLVQHAPVFPAFGYRFDTPTGSVAFSGDTGECDERRATCQGRRRARPRGDRPAEPRGVHDPPAQLRVGAQPPRELALDAGTGRPRGDGRRGANARALPPRPRRRRDRRGRNGKPPCAPTSPARSSAASTSTSSGSAIDRLAMSDLQPRRCERVGRQTSRPPDRPPGSLTAARRCANVVAHARDHVRR